MADFGMGLGTAIGGALGHEDIKQGTDKVNGIASGFNNTTAPYNDFGSSFLAPTSNILLGQTTGDGTIGQQRLEGHGNDVQQYGDFMKSYTASPGSQYLIGQAQEAQNNSAASKGKLLSGGNLRGLDTLTEGLSNTFANQAYGQYLAGNQQQFGQLESALGNMFGAIGVGTTATGQQAGVANLVRWARTQALPPPKPKTISPRARGSVRCFRGWGR
jgi:hypothetical protein